MYLSPYSTRPTLFKIKVQPITINTGHKAMGQMPTMLASEHALSLSPCRLSDICLCFSLSIEMHFVKVFDAIFVTVSAHITVDESTLFGYFYLKITKTANPMMFTPSLLEPRFLVSKKMSSQGQVGRILGYVGSSFFFLFSPSAFDEPIVYSCWIQNRHSEFSYGLFNFVRNCLHWAEKLRETIAFFRSPTHSTWNVFLCRP